MQPASEIELWRCGKISLEAVIKAKGGHPKHLNYTKMILSFEASVFSENI